MDRVALGIAIFYILFTISLIALLAVLGQFGVEIICMITLIAFNGFQCGWYFYRAMMG